MEFNAPQVQASARSNAPWTDRTSNARNGLFAEAFSTHDNAGIVLYHSVDYGVWLELANDQRFAIVRPTIEQYGPIVMEQARQLLGKVG